jgi:hypothetical protein
VPSPLTLMKWLRSNVAKTAPELEALQTAMAKRIALEEAAKSRFSQPDVPAELTLKHGSPYKFDKFDFEANLRKGEGAMAFGPGGYLTGHDPLAREYARNLYAKKSAAAHAEGKHQPMKEALRQDPQAAAEYLRAINVGKVTGLGGDTPPAIVSAVVPPSLPPHILARLGDAEPNVNYWGHPRFGFKSTVSFEDFSPYTQALLNAGLDPAMLKRRIGAGGVSPEEAVRMGREMRSSLQDAPGVRPRIQERLELQPGQYGSFSELAQEVGRAPEFYVPGLYKIRQNLNSTYRVAEGKPGSTGYSPSMKGAFDLRNPGTGATDELARRVYSAPLNASLADLVPYDFPLSSATPELVGRLSQLGEKYGVLDQLTPDMVGKDALDLLYKGIGGGALDKMRAFKEAQIPGHFFLRGGRRNGLPEQIRPDDYNYVIYDQDKLGAPDVTEFSRGGRV